jgi:hypothetical protein
LLQLVRIASLTEKQSPGAENGKTLATPLGCPTKGAFGIAVAGEVFARGRSSFQVNAVIRKMQPLDRLSLRYPLGKV